jgi:hypothetical protein
MTNIQYNPKEKYPNERSITKFQSETKKKKLAVLPPTTLATRLKPRLKRIYAHLWWRSMQATGSKPTSATGLKVAIPLA